MLIPMGFLAASGASVVGSYDLISTTILTSSQTSVTFNVTGLGSTYKHLQIRIAARLGSGFTERSINIRFNADGGSNYTSHRLTGDGSSVTSGSEGPRSDISIGSLPAANATGSAYGAMVVDLLDPFSSTKNKTARVLNGNQAAPSVQLRSGAWLSTSAITSITFAEYFSSSSFIAGSRFSIYGVK